MPNYLGQNSLLHLLENKLKITLHLEELLGIDHLLKTLPKVLIG
jgi:hypothetical protein